MDHLQAQSKSRRSLTDAMLRLQFLDVLVYFLTTPLKNGTLTHYVILLGAGITMLCILNVLSSGTFSPAWYMMILGLAAVGAASLLASFSAFQGSLVYSVVCFAFLAILISVNRFVEISEGFVRFIFWANLALALMLSVQSLLPFAYLRDNGTVSPNLTLYLSNSNYTGMVLLAVMCLLVITTAFQRVRWPMHLLTFYLLYLIYRTASRTAMVAALIFLLLSQTNRKKPISKLTLVLCLTAPFLFVPLYLILYRYNPSAGVQILGKSLFSGRENTFQEYLRNLETPMQYLIGNLCGARLQNAHNAPLAIFTSLGVLGCGLFYSLYANALWKNNQGVSTEAARSSVAALLSITVASCGEASMFLGGFPGISFMVLFLWLSHDQTAEVV